MTIKAKIICDSINPRGTRITTYELEYPRFVHSEMLTHRMFSRNCASSRAIPVKTMLELIEANPAMPVHWGKNQPGMQASEELDENSKESAKGLWLQAMKEATSIARVMNGISAHKQVVNRLTETFQHMKVVVTATEYNNWFWLRAHTDADPTIAELAYKMKEEYEKSTPLKLQYGEWHLPYVNRMVCEDGLIYTDSDGEVLSVEDARMISASSCAQTSYRKNDESLEKAKAVFKRLIESEPVHASPVEHQAMCFCEPYGDEDGWPEGVTHKGREGTYWSGNFRDWIQFRQLIPNNVKAG